VALLWMEAWDQYGDSEADALDGVWAQLAGYTYVSTERSRTGTSSLKLQGDSADIGSFARRILGDTYTTVGMGLSWYVGNLPVQNRKSAPMEFRNSANEVQVSIVVQTTGAIEVYAGDALDPDITPTSLAKSADGVVSATAWQHIEAEVYCHDSAGYVVVKVNEDEVINVTGVDTLAQATSGIAQIGIRNLYLAQSPSTFADDIFTWTPDIATGVVDFVGDKRVGMLELTADTAQADWTPYGTASGWDALTEVPSDDDGSYIQSSTAGDISEFAIADLPSTLNTITAVQTCVKQRKNVPGTCTTRVSLNSASVLSDGADYPLTSNWTYYMDVHETDPNTGVAWTKSGLDAALLRLTRVA